jgi:hypothetical protein
MLRPLYAQPVMHRVCFAGTALPCSVGTHRCSEFFGRIPWEMRLFSALGGEVCAVGLP